MQAWRHAYGMGLCVALYIASPPLVRGPPRTKARTLHIESLNALSSQELSRTAGQFEAIAPEPWNKKFESLRLRSLEPTTQRMQIAYCLVQRIRFPREACRPRLVAAAARLGVAAEVSTEP